MTITIKDDIICVSLDTSREPVREAIKTLPGAVVNHIHPLIKIDTEIDLGDVPHSNGYLDTTENLLGSMSEALTFLEARSSFNMWVRCVLVMTIVLIAAPVTTAVQTWVVTLTIVVSLIASNITLFYRKTNKRQLAIESLRHHFAQEYAYLLSLESEHLNQTVKEFKTLIGLSIEKEYNANQRISQLEVLLKKRDEDTGISNDGAYNRAKTNTPTKNVNTEHNQHVAFLESSHRALTVAYNDVLNTIPSTEVSAHVERCRALGVELNIVSVDEEDTINWICSNQTIH